MSWLSRFLPVRTLEAIPPEGTHVDADVIVTSADLLASPIAPTRPIIHGQHLRLKAFVVPGGGSRGGYREAQSEPVADLRAVRAVHLCD